MGKSTTNNSKRRRKQDMEEQDTVKHREKKREGDKPRKEKDNIEDEAKQVKRSKDLGEIIDLDQVSIPKAGEKNPLLNRWKTLIHLFSAQISASKEKADSRRTAAVLETFA